MRTASAATLLAMTLTFASGACDGQVGQDAKPSPPTCPGAEPEQGTECGGVVRFCGYRVSSPEGNVSCPTRWVCEQGFWNNESLPGKCGAGPDDGGTCEPGNVSSFMPSWKPPSGLKQGKCTDVQAGVLVDCLNNAADASCNAFVADGANQNCIRCAVTPSTAAVYGPLVEGIVTLEVNVPGCIAQSAGDLSSAGCGAKLLALSQCEQAACEANCPGPVGDSAAYAALLACKTKAVSTSCAAFAAEAACANALEGDGGVAAVCAQSGATFAENAKAMVKLFCGGVVSDGGIGDGG